MFEFYQRNYPTGQRGKTGNTPKRSHPDDQRTVFYVPPYPSVTQGSPGTRFATGPLRGVAGHAQNAPVDSVESRWAIVAPRACPLGGLALPGNVFTVLL